ncbi:MAG: hypothetical protein BIFFINMI_01753 [Phycisphaerae bacterium]|nr:hypothetical protein [Phycisphaerae bacterium]
MSPRVRFATVVIIAMLSAPALGRDYVVSNDGDDANAGTLDKPLKDPIKAAAKLVAGDRLVFRAGLYKCRTNGTWGLAPSHDGSADAPITFINHDNEHVRIDCTGSDWGVTPNGYSYVVFDGLDITNPTHYGMKISAASSRKNADGGFVYSSHVTVRNCEVHHTGMECIFAYGTEHLTIENNHLHDSAGSHGLYLQSGCHHPRIRFNTSENNRGNSGMQLNAAGPKEENFITDAVVENNLLRGNAQGFSLMAVCDSVFRRNVLYDNCFNGPRSSGYREVICWTYGDKNAGKPGNPCRNVTFEHNTIVNTRPKYISHLFDVKSNTSGLVLRNNILAIAAAKPLMTVAEDSVAGMVWQNNLWLTPAAAQVNFGDKPLALDDFLRQIKAPTGGNLTGEPKLADPAKGDFTPQPGSPAIDAAAKVDNPTVEAAGKGPDIGAVEAGAKPPVRVGCLLPWRDMPKPQDDTDTTPPATPK